MRRRLDRDGVVVLDDGYAQAQVTLPDGRVEPLASVASDRGMGKPWGALVSPSLAAELGVDTPVAGLLYVADEPLTGDQADDVAFMRDDFLATGDAAESYLSLSVRWPSRARRPCRSS